MVAGGSSGRYRVLKRLYVEGKTRGMNELRLQQKQKIASPTFRAQVKARPSDRPGFATYLPILKNTAQRKLSIRPSTELAKERRGARWRRMGRWA